MACLGPPFGDNNSILSRAPTHHQAAPAQEEKQEKQVIAAGFTEAVFGSPADKVNNRNSIRFGFNFE